MDMPLFSLIILCYRKFEYLYAAIDSALSQDYPNIELVISDDGSPNFPHEDIEAYISAHKGRNISNVIIRQEASNCGTVRHLNHAISECRGAYIVALAGDDNFYNEHTLSRYVRGFSNAPENCYIEMAQTAMYDSALEELEGYYLKPLVQDAIEKTETDSTELLQMLIKCGACLPSTSTCFKKEFFEKFGKFDERYTLVEDYPMHIRLAEEGWIIHYENFVAIKHRHGGISHGQENTMRKSVILYFTDFQQMIETCLLPRINVLEPKDRENVRYRMSRELLWIQLLLARSHRRIGRIISLGLQHPLISYSLVLGKLVPLAAAWRKRLFFPMLALLAFSASIAQMAQTVFPISPGIAVEILTVLRLMVCVLWLFSWGISIMDGIRQKIDNYSGYWLSIN